MTDKASPATPVVPPEFYADVNAFIDMANGIEKRLDSHNAQLAMMHGFSRYAAHHYLRTAKVDDLKQRESFANYITKGVLQLVMENLTQMAGPVAAPAGQKAPPAK